LDDRRGRLGSGDAPDRLEIDVGEPHEAVADHVDDQPRLLERDVADQRLVPPVLRRVTADLAACLDDVADRDRRDDSTRRQRTLSSPLEERERPHLDTLPYGRVRRRAWIIERAMRREPGAT
jgi:hypothetical protein